MPENDKPFKLTEKIVISAIFLSVAVIVNYFRVDLLIAGVPLLRISVSAPFLSFIAILFGPLYGGIAATLSDIISFFIKPSGPYLWMLTLVAFLKYVSIGFLWFKVRDMNFKIFNFIFAGFFVVIGVTGILNTVFLSYLPNSGYSMFLSGLDKNISFSTSIPIIVSLFGILIHLLVYFFSKRSGDILFFEKYLKLMTAAGIPSLLFTALNTVLLIKYLILTSSQPFFLLLVPRLVNSLATVLFSTYLIIILLNIYNKYLRNRRGE